MTEEYHREENTGYQNCVSNGPDWTLCFNSCAAFWHVCLAHIDANLLSPALCGPCT